MNSNFTKAKLVVKNVVCDSQNSSYSNENLKLQRLTKLVYTLPYSSYEPGVLSQCYERIRCLLQANYTTEVLLASLAMTLVETCFRGEKVCLGCMRVKSDLEWVSSYD